MVQNFYTQNIDEIELGKFKKLATQWWDLNGPCRTLHHLNLARVQFINSQINLCGKCILDIGSGGGILSEKLCTEGAHVIGIDASSEIIAVAKNHLNLSKLAIKYKHTTAEQYAMQHDKTFDIITCMELLEHVPDTSSLVKACTKLVKPNGLIFFSMLNRSLVSYFIAIIGAEYILELVPKQTHDYQKFLQLAELNDILVEQHLSLQAITGVRYNPITHRAILHPKISVNYLVCVKQNVI